ncbi:MAG: biotin--[acetyl-CoA-carboxylase] ligase [Pseudomonadota bacterium]
MKWNVIKFDTIDSTHDYLYKNGGNLSDSTVATAEFQSAGHGREKRGWIAKRGASLLMSMLLKPKITIEQASQISLVLAASMIRVIAEFSNRPHLTPPWQGEEHKEIQFKWPNDILIDGKKVSGILAQSSVKGRDLEYVVLSMGLNIGQDEDELIQIDRPATSLSLHIKTLPHKNEILNLILDRFTEDYKSFIQNGLASSINFLEKHDSLIGKEIVLDLGTTEFIGIAEGLDQKGLLIIKSRDGKKKSVGCGEVIKVISV